MQILCVFVEIALLCNCFEARNYWAKISAEKIWCGFPYLKLKPDLANTWILLQKKNCSILFWLWVFSHSGLPDTWHQGVKYDFIIFS